MPSKISAIKRVRQNERRRLRNQRRKRTVRDLVKQINNHLDAGEKDKAQALMPAFNKAVDKAAQRNVFHTNKAARIKSRQSKKVAAA